MDPCSPLTLHRAANLAPATRLRTVRRSATATPSANPRTVRGTCSRRRGSRGEYDGILAVDDVSFGLDRGRVLGVIGASGSGKTTLARMLLGLETPDAGTVTLDGEPWVPLPERERRPRRHRLAAVVQDPGVTFGRTVERRTGPRGRVLTR
ncbi:ATP-binding cassette domain-containing protein [Curtobacterium flaccumfaciens]|nr:ATP-binding cassette domain-containing protein [Curtobacterium flaccumfaciens]